MDDDFLVSTQTLSSIKSNNNIKKFRKKISKKRKKNNIEKKSVKKRKSLVKKSSKIKNKKHCKLLALLLIICLICCLIFLCNFFFIFKNIKQVEELPTKDNSVFIVSLYGQKQLKREHKAIKYFYTLNKYIPKSRVFFFVSEYTEIDPKLIQYQNLIISVERYGNLTFEEIKKKHNSIFAYFVSIRHFFYLDFLKKHPEIKYLILADEDTLFFKDPLPLLAEDPNIVHVMEDIFPYSNTKDANYIWTNAWVQLKDSIKQKCGFKHFNKTLLSDDIKNLIPLNDGLMIGSSKNILKILQLMTYKYICTETFPSYSDQGLFNYLDLTGDLKELGFTIHRHSIYNGTFLSCPNRLSIEDFSRLINSDNFIAVHHYQHLSHSYIRKSLRLSEIIFNTNFN